MAQPNHTRRLVLMEEDITVLYCLIDDAYAHLNPNARRYESLKRLATRIALKIAADTYAFLVNRRLGRFVQSRGPPPASGTCEGTSSRGGALLLSIC